MLIFAVDWYVFIALQWFPYSNWTAADFYIHCIVRKQNLCDIKFCPWRSNQIIGALRHYSDLTSAFYICWCLFTPPVVLVPFTNTYPSILKVNRHKTPDISSFQKNNSINFLSSQPVLSDDDHRITSKKIDSYSNGHVANGIANGHAKQNGIANGTNGIRSRKVQ